MCGIVGLTVTSAASRLAAVDAVRRMASTIDISSVSRSGLPCSPLPEKT
jgi:hypothetical protein